MTIHVNVNSKEVSILITPYSGYPAQEMPLPTRTNEVVGGIAVGTMLVVALLPIVLAVLPPNRAEVSSNREQIMRQTGYNVPANSDSLDQTIRWYLRH